VQRSPGELLAQTAPEDLLQYGLIPEFIGRLPVMATLHELSEEMLVEILTEPKDALIKQYQRLFEMEQVSLRFTPEALRAVAHRALERKTGARGLRSILEAAMLDLMYDLPSRRNVREVRVNEDTILKHEPPILMVAEKESA